MIIASVTAALMGAFLAFLGSTALYEYRYSELTEDADHKVDLTIEGLKRYGMIGISIGVAHEITRIINERPPGMRASFDEAAGTIFFVSAKDPNFTHEWIEKDIYNPTKEELEDESREARYLEIEMGYTKEIPDPRPNQEAK
jgi:hypothetical protein